MANLFEKRTNPDTRDDFEDCDPGFITVQDGRLGLNVYSDNDSDDEEMDYQMIHNRRNTRCLPSEVPDPYFKRRES